MIYKFIIYSYFPLVPSYSLSRLWRATCLRQLGTSTGSFVRICQQRRKVSGSREGIITQASSYWAHWTWSLGTRPTLTALIRQMDLCTLKLKSEPCFSAWCPVFLDKSSERKVCAELSLLWAFLHTVYSALMREKSFNQVMLKSCFCGTFVLRQSESVMTNNSPVHLSLCYPAFHTFTVLIRHYIITTV